MKRSYILLFLLLTSFACSDDLQVTAGSAPGSISGRIYPREGGATVGIYQSVINLIRESETKADGTFIIDEVPPGNYLLKISASGYGRFERNVFIGSGEARDIGDVMLLKFPWPILFSDIDRLEGDFPVIGTISYRASQNFDEDVSESAITITPEVSDLEVSISRSSIRIFGDWNFSTEYTIKLDTTIRTSFGEPLEFPWTESFTTELFRIISIFTPSIRGVRSSARIVLNGEVTEQTLKENITITPDILFDTRTSTSFRSTFTEYITPKVRWPSGTTSININKELSELGGSTLASDTTFTVIINLMRVFSTIPSDGEAAANDSLGISIRFDTPLNIGTAQNAISINPPVIFSAEFGSSDEFLFINPDSVLPSATTFTVTIDTSLKDIWGHPMDLPYQFSFTTK